MKKIMTACFLSLAVPAFAQYELNFPSLQEQVEAAQLETVQKMVEIAETDPYFAGKLFTAMWKGEVYKVVDRRTEPQKPSTTPPPRDRFMELSQSLGVSARGKVRIEVKIDKKADGSSTETWIFEADMGWQAQEDMSEAVGKQHR